ncbi:MAG: hypothetical protein LBS60_01605 [Deltaproteobacteria bacterium]|jgi:hypothetical protein|nr:hypothetical protein [Deltaproteobacteria bacterium]
MLTSYIPGRLRVRLTKTPDETPENIDVSAWPGVKKLTVNPQSGGFLLEYDPDKLSLETIIEVLEAYDPEAAEQLSHIAAGGRRYPGPAPVPPGQATKDFISLTTSLLSSVITGYVGPKKWHAISGLVLAGTAIAHAWRYRHRIKPLAKWTFGDILGFPTSSPPRPASMEFEEEEYSPEETELKAEPMAQASAPGAPKIVKIEPKTGPSLASESTAA